MGKAKRNRKEQKRAFEQLLLVRAREEGRANQVVIHILRKANAEAALSQGMRALTVAEALAKGECPPPDPVLSEVFCRSYWRPWELPPPPPPLWMRICEKLGLGKAVWVTFGRNNK